MDELAGEVVLDDEGPRLAGDPDDFASPGRGEDRTGRVLEERLAYENARAGGPEGCGEQFGSHPVGVDRHRDRPQSGGAGGRQHARVGG